MLDVSVASGYTLYPNVQNIAPSSSTTGPQSQGGAAGRGATWNNLSGETNTIDIPAGIQSGKQLRQRGAGMPILQGRGRGDLVVEIQVETPTRLSKEQRALLEQFRETETGDECPESRGFFDRLKDVFG